MTPHMGLLDVYNDIYKINNITFAYSEKVLTKTSFGQPCTVQKLKQQMKLGYTFWVLFHLTFLQFFNSTYLTKIMLF